MLKGPWRRSWTISIFTARSIMFTIPVRFVSFSCLHTLRWRNFSDLYIREDVRRYMAKPRHVRLGLLALMETCMHSFDTPESIGMAGVPIGVFHIMISHRFLGHEFKSDDIYLFIET